MNKTRQFVNTVYAVFKYRLLIYTFVKYLSSEQIQNKKLFLVCRCTKKKLSYTSDFV